VTMGWVNARTVSIVVVNWNAGAALGTCVASVAADAAAGAEVLVVDNGSTDGSTQTVCAEHPWARAILAGTNLGFAAGANRGAEAARGEVLVFLNPDAVVQPGALARLCAALDAPRIAIAGGGLTDTRGRWQPAAARFAPIRHLLLDTTPGRALARHRRRVHRVDWVYGTFMAVRANVFRALGGFDRAYFLYGEDADLCFRARAGGWFTVLVPAAVAAHGPNVSARRRFGTGRDAAVIRGELQFYASHGPAMLRRFRRVALMKFGTKAAIATLLGRRDDAAELAAVLRECRAERWRG